MVNAITLQKEIDTLKDRNRRLERRISKIESELGGDYSKKDSDAEEKKKENPKSHSSFEEKVGLKWFSIVGILALVIGVGFFIKFAFENNWVDYLTRIVIGVVIGICLVIGGEIVSKKEKYEFWGKILIGGGFAIAYFAVYSAYHFKSYREAIGISLTLDISLLAVLAVIAILFSLKDNSMIIATEAFFLGYITTFLGNSIETLSLIFTLILAICLAFVVIRKKWTILSIGGVIATYLMYALWYFDSKVTFLLGFSFLAAYFALFILLVFLTKFDKASESNLVTISLINAISFYLASYFLVREFYPKMDGLFTLTLSLIFLLGYYLAILFNKNKLSLVNLYLGLLFLTITIPIQLNNEWITIIWSLELVILTLLAVNFKSENLAVAAHVVGAITVVKTLLYDSWSLEGFDVTNILASTRVFSFVITIIALYFVVFYLGKNVKKVGAHKSILGLYFVSAGALSVLIILLEFEGFWISTGWALFAIISIVLGFIIKEKGLRFQGIVILGLTVIKVFLYDTRELGTLPRTISFIVLGVILLLASLLYSKYKDKLREIL